MAEDHTHGSWSDPASGGSGSLGFDALRGIRSDSGGDLADVLAAHWENPDATHFVIGRAELSQILKRIETLNQIVSQAALTGSVDPGELGDYHDSCDPVPSDAYHRRTREQIEARKATTRPKEDSPL